MKIINKLQKLSIEKAFYIYIAFNLINLLIHIAGFYSYPLFAQMDYALYLIKIGIVYWLRHLLLKKDSLFLAEAKMFKGIMICDLIELFVSVFSYSDSAATVIYLTFTIKAILDFGVFASLLFKESFSKIGDRLRVYKAVWITLNICTIGVCIQMKFALMTVFLCFLFAFILIRFFFQFYFVYYIWNKVINQYDQVNIPDFSPIEKTDYVSFKYMDEKYDPEILRSHQRTISKAKSSNCFRNYVNRLLRIDKRYRYATYFCIFICFLFMRNTYKNGYYQLIDDNGNVLTNQKSLDQLYHVDNDYCDDNEVPVYQYNKCNLMPSWSMFYHEKYGLINIETGSNTGAKYDDHLWFDNDGIAYDYNRHFIDINGEEIIDVPYIVKAKSSFRQVIINKLIAYSSINDRPMKTIDCLNFDYGRNEFDLYTSDTYFVNGLTRYHTDYNDKYGLMSEDGTLVTLPKYTDLWGFSNHEVFCVTNYNYTGYGVINNKGKSLIKDTTHSIDLYEDLKMFKCGSELYKYDGTQMEGSFYCFNNGKTGNVYCFQKNNDSNKEDVGIMVFYKDSDPIFCSDLYCYCYSYADDSGDITYLVVHDKNGKSLLIDLNGDLICPGSYSDILTTSEYDTFIGINDDERIDILHLDGTVIETEYKYAGKGDAPTTILVINMDDDTLFSYMNLDGYLVHGWFEK